MPTSRAGRNWGDDRALLNDEEARDRLLDAAERCVIARGDTQIRMAEVADSAKVVRSTVYRYYPNRDDLLLGLILRRVDRACARWVAELRKPQHAASSIRDLVLLPVAAVDSGDPLNLALYAGESAGLATVLEAGSQSITDVVAARFGPLFTSWKDDGQVYADLDLRETVQWMSATSSFLLTASWRHRPLAAKRRFVDRYVIRALVR
ncbi:TetR/AcrR family transcriptional regulator [Mycobacterium sp. ITM-2016-00317]|uniref:TetR/AcrR family transcriptional regulator n=1 Tax=Mycobacterium sp. ITM-2016-00317 TaxID=2099694 RepID=UPI00287F8C0C|nr:TetR/AcrR family transcriptional regulator [Mycobacterium sp. ITM-2016-00317]WNG85478.1 TetR/AcrR family transcriptional regulator [Mycobacterium sp. ITM-2016-00317]